MHETNINLFEKFEMKFWGFVNRGVISNLVIEKMVNPNMLDEQLKTEPYWGPSQASMTEPCEKSTMSTMIDVCQGPNKDLISYIMSKAIVLPYSLYASTETSLFKV